MSPAKKSSALILIVVLALLGALVVAGCGGSGGTTTEETTSEEAPAGTAEESKAEEEPAEEEPAEEKEAEEPAEAEGETGGAEAESGAESAAMTEGKSIFTANCATCHTLKAAGATGEVGPNLDELKPEQAIVEHQVINGGGPMPAFGKQGILNSEEIKAVATYVSSVAGKG